MIRSSLFFFVLKSITVVLIFFRQVLGVRGYQGSDIIMQILGYFFIVGCGGRCESDFRGQCLYFVFITVVFGIGVTIRIVYEAFFVFFQFFSVCKGRGGWSLLGGGVVQCFFVVFGFGRWRVGSIEREGSIFYFFVLSFRVCAWVQLFGWVFIGVLESVVGF